MHSRLKILPAIVAPGDAVLLGALLVAGAGNAGGPPAGADPTTTSPPPTASTLPPCPSPNPANEMVLAGETQQTAKTGAAFQDPLAVQLTSTDGCPVTAKS
jgi:hypothetical protein